MNILKKHNLYERTIDSITYIGAENHCVNYGEVIINFEDGTYLGFMPKYISDGTTNNWKLCEDRNYIVENENNKFVIDTKLDIDFYRNNPFYIVNEKYKGKKIQYLKSTESEVIIKIENDVLFFKVVTEKEELSQKDIVLSHNIDKGSETMKGFEVNMLFTMQIA